VRKTRPLRGAARIGLTVGSVLDRRRQARHFDLTISEAHFVCARKDAEIEQEAALDGLYAMRTSLPEETIDDAGAVRAYKSPSRVERAFRCPKTVDLRVRPIHHWLEQRVRAYVFLCVLAYDVEWIMRLALAPCST
jgi:transposase